MEKCVFCNIITKNKNEVILYEDDIFVIFKDTKPDAKEHFQAVPKTHIKNCNSLTKEHFSMLCHMKEKSLEFIKQTFDGNIELK